MSKLSCVMPIIKSAIKRMRQNAVRQERRKPVKTYMKTMIRKLQHAVKDGKKEEAATLLPETYKAIDMAAKKFIIHPKNAARKKSNMAKLVAAK